MGAADSPSLRSVFQSFLARMRYPHLFGALLALLVLDLVVADPLPFVDEALLAVLTALVGSLRARRRTPPPATAPRDVTDRGSDRPA